jgi:sulfur-oxidizing protein SoxY
VARLFRLLLMIAGLVAATAPARAQDANPNPEDSAIWRNVHASLFADAKIEPAEGVLTLETPKRAEDAAIVPVAIRSRFPQGKARYVDTIWLIIDNNPSPIAAVFRFTAESGRADMETRIRIEQYTHVRAIARTNDGRLYMAVNYVKASGGCSAPAGKDALAARATLGRMRMRVDDTLVPGKPALAQLMISHPNDSGLAMDQVTRTYAAPHYVRKVEVTYAGKPVLQADVDFSISENPNFRFYFTPDGSGELAATVVDNQDLHFATTVKLDTVRGGAASSAQ